MSVEQNGRTLDPGRGKNIAGGAALPVLRTTGQVRILALGFQPDVLVRAQGSRSWVVHCVDKLEDVSHVSWDVLVTSRGVPETAAPHLFVIAFGGMDFGFAEGGTARARILRGRKIPTGTLVTPQAAPSSVKALVAEDLVPKAGRLPFQTVLSEGVTRNTFVDEPPGKVRPFLTTSDGEIVAGSFVRLGGRAECWCLPEYADPRKWIAAALEEWTPEHSSRAPAYDVGYSERWLTPREQRALERQELLQRIIQSVLHRTRTQLSEAEEELIRATQFAEARERLLLTAQGPALVTAVKQALEALGFEIETGGGHGIPDAATEDLRVASPDDPNWEAVVQIHAREEGVTPDDVLQLYMCRSRYEREKGREPPRAWCVVNQVMGKDPFERQELFKACQEYIPALSEDGALLLDTSVLLELWLAVQREAVSWEGARHLLMNAKGCLVSDDVVQLTKQEDGGRSGPA